MAEVQVTFDAGTEYERFMGRWSRAVGERFLAWLAPPIQARWLDVGCGTGAFTEIVLRAGSPQQVTAIDPAPAQIEHALRLLPADRIDLRVADAMSLPFDDGAFDVVVSALVINFIPDRARALREMRRVVRPGGIVGAYLWNRSPTTEFSPRAPMEQGLQAIGAEVLRPPLAPESTSEGLKAALDAAGLSDAAITTIEVTQAYRDFDDYWDAQTPSFHPIGKSVAALTVGRRARLRETMRALLPPAFDGSITYSARAIAFKARRPD